MDKLGGYLIFMDLEFENILNVEKRLQEKVRIWRNNEEIKKYMFTNHQISKEEHNRWIEKLKNDENKKAWIIKNDKKPIGFVQLLNIDFINRTTEWGFYIYDKKARGKGFGYASLLKLMKIVFEEMNLEKMCTKVLENNNIALKLYKKFGFENEGKLKEKLDRDGKEISVYIMSISKEKWENIKKQVK